MKRFTFNRPLRRKPRVTENLRQMFTQARSIRSGHATLLSPYVVSPPPEDSENPILLMGNCTTDDELLSNLCWLTNARDDALQDLLAAVNYVDRKGVSRDRIQSVYEHWGFVQQIDNATAVFVGALIERSNQSRQCTAGSGK